jgi:hypothetical protein
MFGEARPSAPPRSLGNYAELAISHLLGHKRASAQVRNETLAKVGKLVALALPCLAWKALSQ